MYQVVQQTSILNNNVSLIATNILSTANSLLAPHGIRCELVMVQSVLPNVIKGKKNYGMRIENIGFVVI